MASRFRKPEQVEMEPPPHRGNQGSMKGSLKKWSAGPFKKTDHSGGPKDKLSAKGFKNIKE